MNTRFPRPTLRSAVATLLTTLLTAGQLPAAVTAPEMDPGWPREIVKNGAKLTYYQPQIDEWKNYREITARVAFSLTPKGGKPTLGVASLKAKTVTDMDARSVVVKTIQIQDVRFPSLDQAADDSMSKLFESVFPTQGMTVGLDRMLAAVERTSSSSTPAIELKNDPPQIFASEGPAILLFVDGDPVYGPIEGTKLKFVVNTNWDLFFDEASSRYYLLNDPVWMTSDALNGDWAITNKVPAEMSKLPKDFADVRKYVPPPPVKAQSKKIFFSSKPAELIAFEGKPVWADIPGTRLVYAKNTESDVFVQKDESQYYFLVAGRWFRAESLDGPWSFASADLPKDFARIPPKSPKGTVLACVPGTPQAADAVLLAQVPTTVVVTRAEAEKAVKVAYDGDPKFVAIEGTSCAYATNTQEKVIKIGDLYYLCFQGVWFMSTSPSGPWKTCDSVPKEIYTIPASSPVYNVTYVTVSNPTPTTVECSHTSGYLGVFVVGMAVGAACVYGSGWYYPPYFYYPPYYRYPIYRPYPYAYGYGAWYNPATGRYGHGGAVYGPYGMAGGAAWYNPSTGRYGRHMTVQTPRGGRTYSQSYNPYTGVYSQHAGGWSPYGSWGSTAVQRGNDWAVSNRVTTSQGTARHTYTSSGAEMYKYRTDSGQTVRVAQDADNNVYAGKDGNVYKRDESGSWSKYENGEWSSVEKPQSGRPKSTSASSAKGSSTGKTQPSTQPSSMSSSASRPSTSSYGGASSDVVSDLNRESSARSRGSQASRDYSSYRSSSSGGGKSRSSYSGSGGGRRKR